MGPARLRSLGLARLEQSGRSAGVPSVRSSSCRVSEEQRALGEELLASQPARPAPALLFMQRTI